jgi:predicted AAA+ superfamily ATPase
MWENIQVIRYLNKILPPETIRSIVLITGARQTGKTTLVKKNTGNYPILTWMLLS